MIRVLETWVECVVVTEHLEVECAEWFVSVNIRGLGKL